MKWFCNYCKEEHDSRDPSLFPPETFVHSETSGEHIAKTENPTKPPHLRESKGEKACWNCWAYKKGHCEMFGGYKVREDQVCDDWEKKRL